MKYIIHINQRDNEIYFDNKLSKKHKSLIIERIIRDIKTESGQTTGIVTRRGKCPLEVVKIDDQWKVKGETEERSTNTKQTKPKERDWNSLTNHEQILLTAVKFNLFEDWEECEQAVQKAIVESSIEGLFNNIPRLKENQVYYVDDKKYKIIKNNGKTVIFFGPDGQQKRTLEADTFGEFIRLENCVLHSVDFIKESK